MPRWEAGLSSRMTGKRVGIPKEYRVDGMPRQIEALWQAGIDWLRDAGAEIVDVALPHTRYALPAYYIIAPAEASSNLARYDGVRYGLRDLPEGAGLQDMYAATRADGFGAEVKRRIMIGTYVLSAGFYDAYYTQAQKVRTLIARDFEAAWATCDVLLTPTAPSAAFALGEKIGRSAGDVPQRRVHRAVVAGGAAGDERAGRARQGGAAAGAADHRQAARRAGRAQRRAGDRGAGRVQGTAGRVVVRAPH